MHSIHRRLELSTDYSPYVDEIVQACKVFSNRIDTLGVTRVPKIAVTTIWTEVYTQLNKVFIDGFASAKKCSVGGR